MEKYIPWYSDERVSMGTSLGGLSLVTLGILLQIGEILPEIIYPVLLKILIISLIIHTLVDIYTSEHWDAGFPIYTIQRWSGGVVGASVWIFIVIFVLNSIMASTGMNLWVVASVIGLLMYLVMHNLYP